MDAARSFIAMGPVAIYLLVLGVINFIPRPFVTTGLRDLAALGVAVCGLFLVGPVELFAPTEVVAKMGIVFWLSILGFYVSSITLLLLLLPPRLVVYNIKAEQLRPVLSRVAQRLDADPHWLGDVLQLPNAGLQLAVRPFNVMRNVALVSIGEAQSLQSWRQLEVALRAELRGTRVSPNPRGLSLTLIGLLFVVMLVSSFVSDPQAVARGLTEMFGV